LPENTGKHSPAEEWHGRTFNLKVELQVTKALALDTRSGFRSLTPDIQNVFVAF
jgi:hypothetical protein